MQGLRPLLCSEDMEVQERAHNGQALLAIVLRQLSPTDPALPALAQIAGEGGVTAILVEHEQRCVMDISHYIVHILIP